MNKVKVVELLKMVAALIMMILYYFSNSQVLGGRDLNWLSPR